ncbi:DUF4177 domain-containing protein [Lutimaribacter marinistellae]|uniref:DUF4177 domain-containing protein n=1 Tax=Lutimaribacter marinistellae TaxID=1820329 RepID=A0ABV7TKV7_9RHOB
MIRYEYKVVPAPTKGTKAKTVKTPEGRFALTVEQLLNEMGAAGWEFQRAELLPSDERSGLTGSVVNWRNVLVFRRPQDVEAAQPIASEDEPAVPAPAPDPAQDRPAIPGLRPVPGPAAFEAPKHIHEDADEPPLRVVASNKSGEEHEQEAEKEEAEDRPRD